MELHDSNSTESESNLMERLAALEARVAALESAEPHASESGDAAAHDFWVVDHLESKKSPQLGADHGSVVFGGSVSLGDRQYAYQWERSTDYLVNRDWDEYTERVAAIAHPVRGAILRRLLSAPATVAELVEESIVSSTGTAYHHIGALHSAGWIAKLNGHYEVRPSRVIPLLTIIASGEEH